MIKIDAKITIDGREYSLLAELAEVAKIPDPPSKPTIPASGLSTSEDPASEPKPKLSRGESYTNVFGYRVTRLTDYGAAHFYSDRSPLNADSTLLVAAAIDGGQQRMTRVSTGETWPIAPAGDPRSYSASYWWHATDPNLLYWAAEKAIWTYAPSSREWDLLMDFSRELRGVDGYLNIGGMAGSKIVLDVRNQSKDSRGVILWEIGQPPRIYTGSTIKVAPRGMWFVGAGLTPDGQFLTVQANGSKDPNTLTYVSRWDENPLDSPRPLIPGVVTGHAAMMPSGHARLTTGAPGDGVGYLPPEDASGSPTWLAALRLADFTRDGFPTRDILVWAPRQFGGMHVGGGSKWLTLSTYADNGASPAKAFDGEIVLVDPTGQATATGSPATIKQGAFRRVAHHHSEPRGDYSAQPHAVESGDVVVFTSNMAGQPDVYAVEIQ